MKGRGRRLTPRDAPTSGPARPTRVSPVSRDKQRKARRQAEREAWEREQARLAQARRRRTVLLSVIGTAVAVALVIGLVVALGGDEPEADPGQAQVEDTEALASEEAEEAQGVAAAEARAAGEVVADDFTVEPGTAVEAREGPVPDDRPVACGAELPASARDVRSTYPGGPADVLEDGTDYVARIETSCGPIVIDLLEEDAPVAVNSFVFLAREGFYDGLEVFRDFGAIAGVQAGSGTNAVGWDVGYALPDELDLARREGYPIGSVTTAGDQPYTSGSDFLVAYGKEFDLQYETDQPRTTFGRVLSGMGVIDRMVAMDRVGMGGEAFPRRLFMESVTIQER